MKQTALIVWLMLLALNGFGQWFPVNHDSTFLNTEILFLNEDTGFVVGHTDQSFYEGVISRTLDGGTTWDTTTETFYIPAISFPSTSIGYCGGHDGSVYMTADMGNSWNYLSMTNISNDYSNCYFFNSDSGFVVNWYGQIYKTFDGGINWDTNGVIGGYSPFPGVGSIQFLNDSMGIIAAGYYGTYARTSDAGTSWQTGHIDSNMNVISIYMRNQNIGYAVGYNGKYSRTFDGGQTWTTPTLLSQYHLNDIGFFTDSVGYIVGGNGGPSTFNTTKGIILKTIDGGSNWAIEDSSYDSWLTSIFVISTTTGYAAGWKGRILKITNGNNVNIQESVAISDTLNIFPNPTTGPIQLTINTKHNTPFYFEIINTLGKIVLQSEIKNSQAEINMDVSFLAKGIYVVKVGDGKNFENKKLIIN